MHYQVYTLTKIIEERDAMIQSMRYEIDELREKLRRYESEQ